MTPDNEPIVISSEAKNAAEAIASDIDGRSGMDLCQYDDDIVADMKECWAGLTQLAINSSIAPLKAEIDRLTALVIRRNKIGCCGVCWANSWEQADESDKDKDYVHVDPVNGGYMRCAHCYMIEGMIKQKAEIDRLKEHQMKHLDVIGHAGDKINSLSQQNEQLEKQILTMRESLNIVGSENHNMECPDCRVCQAIDTALSSTPADIAKKWVSREVLEKCVDALNPFRSGVAYVSWGFIKAQLNIESAKKLTQFNYKADEAYTLAQKELEK
jgi:hypothetical protein